jgi:hypothetical protein
VSKDQLSLGFRNPSGNVQIFRRLILRQAQDDGLLSNA